MRAKKQRVGQNLAAAEQQKKKWQGCLNAMIEWNETAGIPELAQQSLNTAKEQLDSNIANKQQEINDMHASLEKYNIATRVLQDY